MMQVKSSAGETALISRDRYGETISAALRLFVGRGRRYSVKQLSNGTGVKDRMIECALVEPGNCDWRALPGDALLSISRFLGAAFTNEWLHLADQGAFDLPDGEEPTPMSIAAEAAEDTATVVRMAADQKWDAAERAQLPEIGRRKIERGMQMIAAGRAA
ncbi:MAG: hypothetical protein PGN16_04325 [Sphingomonas phyllosphaerae]|uniref:hypothetical protein n=1 Tax=Sphingomonas phyllosphaerae TaxID=257003 RepID=UPI002FF7AE3D